MNAPGPEPETVAALIARRADDVGVGLRFGDRSWTWSEVVEEMHARAAVLREVVVGEPFHVGVLLDNVPEYLFLLGGAALAGAVVVGINPTRRGAELGRDVVHTDCRAVVTDGELAGLLEGLDLGPATDRVLAAGQAHYHRLVADARDAGPSPAQPVAPEDLYLLVFTSGTSGAPKAVRMTQGRAYRAATGRIAFRDRDVLYCPMPLFHGNALNAIVFPALASGATIVLRRRFSASAFLPDVRHYGVTFFSTIGRALAYILATPATEHDRDHRLKLALAPESSSADSEAFAARFGCHVVAGYGSSENALIFTPRPGLPPDALGEPLPDLDAAVVDPDTGDERPAARFDEHGRLENAADAIGEIVGRAALHRFEGYYRNPEAAAARSRNGWYWSGDLGYRDEAGVFYFAGRSADWIRVDGENFAAAPVERILERFPGVQGVAVFGVPDDRTADDQVMAVLEVAEPAAWDAAAFDRFLAGQRDLGTKWAPRYVRTVTALPVGATNKIDKVPLRRDRWAVDDPVWWRAGAREPLTCMTEADVATLHEHFVANGRSAALDR